MAKDNSNSFNNSSSPTKEPDSNKSFVKKVRSRVTGLLPSSLSKWFRNDDDSKKAVIRQREEDEDDEYYDIQPPSKRVKIPSSETIHDILHTNSVSPTTFASNDVNRNHSINIEDRQNIRSPFPEPLPGPSGIKSRKTFMPTISVNYNSTETLLNGDKDSDSGESTSGYSSMIRIGQKDLASSTECKKMDNPMPNVKPTSLFNSFLNLTARKRKINTHADQLMTGICTHADQLMTGICTQPITVVYRPPKFQQVRNFETGEHQWVVEGD